MTVIAAEGSLLNARARAERDGYDDAPAVVGGNVETSSRVADVVLGAFGRALGQGTMNNVTLGDEDTVYYETIGGGQGACADADGPSGVHVAMSNTLNTPVEALELEFPMRVVAYALRRGSGGDGEHRGGDGVVREIEALTDLRYSLITERRRHPPPGAAGGHDGAPGRNLLDGAELEPKSIGTLRRGPRLRIETPGGGGYGRRSLTIRMGVTSVATPYAGVDSRACRGPIVGICRNILRFALTRIQSRRVPAARHWFSERASRGLFSVSSVLLPFISYADCFQRMGRHRAGARRGRAAADAPQGRYPRAGEALQARTTSASSCIRRSIISAPTWSASRTGRSSSRALEEGVWADGEPHPQALHRGEALTQPDRVRIRAWAEVAAHYTITDRRAVDALSPFYVWTTDYAEKRLAWKRRHPLHVILLRTYRIPRPVTVKVRDEYGGCRSWLELTRELPFEGTPVLSDEEFERASEEIASIASDRQPVLV